MSRRRRGTRGTACVLVLLAGAAQAMAQELPIRSWSAREGLVHDRVNAFLEDRSGYLWIATWEGLSRFDGREFVNYRPANGLARSLAFTLAEDPRGVLWVGLFGGGVARLLDDPAESSDPGAPRFRSFPVGEGDANDVNEIFFDELGGMWIFTAAGLHRAVGDPDAPQFELCWSDPDPDTHWAPQAIVHGSGSVWLVGNRRALELCGGSIVEHAGPPGSAPRDAVNAEASAEGRAVVATGAGLFVFDVARASRGEVPWTKLEVDLAGEIVHTTAIDFGGRIWVGTVHGLLSLEEGRARWITTANGLPDDWLRILHVGRDGKLWIGTQNRGIARLDEQWIESYPSRARPLGVVHIVEGLEGEIVISTNDEGLFRVVDGGLEQIPGTERPEYRNLGVGFLQDRGGTWWFGKAPRVACTPGSELDVEHLLALPGVEVDAFGYLHEDPRGVIWFGASDGKLYRGAPVEEGLRRFEPLAAHPFGDDPPRTMLTDWQGVLWIAPYTGLWRRRGERIDPVHLSGELPEGGVRPRHLFEDREGRLWIGWRFGGISMLTDPSAESPVCRTLTTVHGLPSDHVAAITEDLHGRIWAGTGGGLAQIDPERWSVRTVTPVEGLAGTTVNSVRIDRDGDLWVATLGGLSRIRTDYEPTLNAAPEVRILHTEIAGVEVRLPERGVTHVEDLVLSAARSSIRFAYGAIDPAHGESLEYQVRFAGTGEDWSAPTRERSVRLGPLAPGSYHLEVRAITSDRHAVGTPARAKFLVQAPLWRRPWFVAGAGALVLAAGFASQRARVRRTLALEQVRARISADLHDEIGSGLAQIAILSELARRELPAGAPDRLGEVADVARSTRRSMADLVWAIDPRCDSLLDLVRRMRQTTGNLFEAEGLSLAFHTPTEEALERLELGPNERRHLFHVFQEAVTNAARHSRAAAIEIEIRLEGSDLWIVVADDGLGFDPMVAAEGHGLAGMRERARALRAELSIDSTPGRGTRVTLHLRTHGRRFRRGHMFM